MRKCVDVHGNMCMGIHGIKRMKISGLLNENEQNKCMWGGEYTQHKHEATTIQQHVEYLEQVQHILSTARFHC